MNTACNTVKKSMGFTLVELLTTVAIVGISLGIGLPNLQSFMQDNQQLNAINEFHSFVTYARNEAVVRNTNVKLCVANATSSGCDTTNTNWANGYVVMAGSTVLKVHDKLPGQQTIRSDNSAGNSLIFSGNGMLNTVGSLNFCDGHSTTARSMIINMGSQMRRRSISAACTTSSS
jgi:type IV fimbrial biogenesis protein FimT